jgi:hypothetical protein
VDAAQGGKQVENEDIKASLLEKSYEDSRSQNDEL